MILRYNTAENKGRERDSDPIEKTEKKESRVTKFCSHLWDAAKVSTQILAVAVGMTVIAYGCGGRPHNSGDADADQIETVDGENDEVSDVPCVGESETLEGEVNPLIASTRSVTTALNSSDSEVSGDVELTVGADVPVVELGQCPDNPDSVAAFGAQGDNIDVTPQYRLDFGQTAFDAEMPDVEASVCPPPEVDSIPVSMFIDETNLAVKAATVGTTSTRAEFGFITPLSAAIIVDSSETTTPVLLDGSGLAVKALMISIESPLLDMATAVHSQTGEIVLEREVRGSIDTTNSKTLRIYQVGSEDRILPTVNWDVPVAFTLCLRSETGGPKDLDIEIIGEVVGEILDLCGEIFAGFNVESLTASIGEFNPPELAGNYSVASSSGIGVGAMQAGNASITATFRRNPVVPDTMGIGVTMEIAVGGELVSVEDNPVTGVQERQSVGLRFLVLDPDVVNYPTVCGYTPSGF